MTGKNIHVLVLSDDDCKKPIIAALAVLIVTAGLEQRIKLTTRENLVQEMYKPEPDLKIPKIEKMAVVVEMQSKRDIIPDRGVIPDRYRKRHKQSKF